MVHELTRKDCLISYITTSSITFCHINSYILQVYTCTDIFQVKLPNLFVEGIGLDDHLA